MKRPAFLTFHVKVAVMTDKLFDSHLKGVTCDTYVLLLNRFTARVERHIPAPHARSRASGNGDSSEIPLISWPTPTLLFWFQLVHCTGKSESGSITLADEHVFLGCGFWQHLSKCLCHSPPPPPWSQVNVGRTSCFCVGQDRRTGYTGVG